MADDAGGMRPGGAALAVLVVNDSEDQRVAIRAMLASLGLAIVEAGSGIAALGATLRRTFALIVMDVRMPSLDGYATAKLIRQRPEARRTPIIFLTAFGRDDERASLVGYATGAVAFMHMPVIPDVFRAKVSAFVDLFLQSDELRHSINSLTVLNDRLSEHRTRMQLVLDNAADGIVTTGERGVIESVNPSARQMFGYSDEEIIGQPLAFIVAPAVQEDFRDLSNLPPEPSPPGRPRPVETLGRRQDGSTFAMEVAQGVIKRDDRCLAIAIVRDISQRKAYVGSLEHQALHDELTGLANRTLFEEHMEQALASAGRRGTAGAVLMMDLDAFAHVNDTLGHDQGDAVLRQVARRLARALRETDTVARLAGDEFAILPGGSTDLAAATAVAGKLREACAAEFKLDDDKAVQISASVGIALFPQHGETAGELLRRADTAMYVAKRSGSGHAVFERAHETQVARRRSVGADLRDCIAHEQLILHYQPKIDLTTRAIAGVEALVRWQHPQRGLLMPDRFIGEAERTDLIAPLTRWVLDAALSQQQTWRAQDIDVAMAVNISAHSLRPTSELPDMIAELTEAWGTAPDRLTLELTEGALIEDDAPRIMEQLHQMGERMSIDDFGTGYSSLGRLQRLPLDELKIDRSFVTDLTAGSDQAVIVRSTIDLAHDLGLTVVAEGVEQQTAMDLLVEYGCDSVQGYLLGRPTPAPQIQWLTNTPHGESA